MNTDEDLIVRTCRVCGCTDDDCSGCIDRTGVPCHWIDDDLCSACKGKRRGTLRLHSQRQQKRSRTESIKRALDAAILPKDARRQGLISITQPFSLRRQDFANEVLNILASFHATAPARQACFVRVGAHLVEVWAKPAKPL